MEQIKLDSKFADEHGEIMVVECGGYVDQSNSHQLQKMFDNILDSNVYKVIVDFTNLYYMSSAGWGIFVGEVKRFRDNGGDIKLAAMNTDIYDVYQMLEFYHILEDYANVKEAAASFVDDSPILDLVKETKTETIEDDDNHKSTDSPPSVGEIFVPGYKRKHEEGEDSSGQSSEFSKEKAEEEEVQEAEERKQEAGSRRQEEGDRKQETGGRGQDAGNIVDLDEGEGLDLEYQASSNVEFMPQRMERKVNLAQLPLTEKIKRVIAENPLLGVFGIKRVLRHEHFGNVRVGAFKLHRILKQLDLHTKAKRYRYYRSC